MNYPKEDIFIKKGKDNMIFLKDLFIIIFISIIFDYYLFNW